MDGSGSDTSGERRSAFKSYIDSPRSSLSSEPAPLVISAEPEVEDSLDLLDGEVIVTKARGVLRYSPLSDQKHGVSGVLVVTNFKLSFVAPGCESGESEVRCEGLVNRLLKPNDTCLANIDGIFAVTDDGRRRKLSHQLLDGMKVDVLEVHCKDFRVVTYGFKFTGLDETKLVINALLHHAFPKRVELLFAFECRMRSMPDPRRTRMFHDAGDWHAEMLRTRCPGWKVSYVNEHFQVSYTLPRHLVVPEKTVDGEVVDAAPHYNKNRVPVWVWGTAEGAALLHSAKTAFENSNHDEIIKGKIMKSHPKGLVHIIDLDSVLPSSADVQEAFVKWRSLHVPCTSEEFREGDNRYYAEIHSSQWLHYVSKCLREACEITSILCDENTSVVLQEGEGRDTAILISSLIQILADPHYRTQVGFQSLIQKEWVALGHPFCSRFARLQSSSHQAQTPVETQSASVASSLTTAGITTLNANPTGMAQSNQTLSAVPATLNFRSEHSRQSPVFLLFLDCVWQILRQYPKEFEFTQTFLTTVWDSAHISIFDTFLFDCMKDRDNAMQSEPDRLTSRSVWTWEYQYEPCYLESFESPWTRLRREMGNWSGGGPDNPSTPPSTNGVREDVPLRKRNSGNRTRTAERAERNMKSRSIPVGQITTLLSRVRRGDFSVTNNFNMDSINWEHGLIKLHEDNDGPKICDLRWNELSDYSRDLWSGPEPAVWGYYARKILRGSSDIDRYLVPRTTLSHLEVWNELYSRWLPITHIRFGGEDAFRYMTEMSLVEDIVELQERLQRFEFSRSAQDDYLSARDNDVNDASSLRFSRFLRVESLISSFPFASERNDLENGASYVENMAGFSRHYSNDDMLDSQSIIESHDI